MFDRDKDRTYDVLGFIDFDYGGDLDSTRSIYGYIVNQTCYMS